MLNVTTLEINTDMLCYVFAGDSKCIKEATEKTLVRKYIIVNKIENVL